MPSKDRKALDVLKLTGGDIVYGPVSGEEQVKHACEAFRPVPGTQRGPHASKNHCCY